MNKMEKEGEAGFFKLLATKMLFEPRKANNPKNQGRDDQDGDDNCSD